MFFKLRKLLSRYLQDMRWYVIVSAFFVYALLSWLLLVWAGETALYQWPDYLYWLVVTSSTVGYGDLSPTTEAGKYAVSLVIIPVGLSLFALILGRAAAWVSSQWFKGAKGMKDLHLDNHILVIGWNGQRTIQLLNLLLREKEHAPNTPDIALCVRADVENPMPDKVEFVRVESFNQDLDMDRACIGDASVIIIDNDFDDMTMTAALYASKRNPGSHIIAYFKDESLVGLLRQHCPNVECTPSVAVEMLAKSAFDPGSSALHHDLLSVQEGQAQYSVAIPELSKPLTVGQLFSGLKKHYDATLIALSDESKKIMLNPTANQQIKAGSKIYYIAENRITRVDWEAMYAE
ncbi:ion channel [Lacimicrobium alkaliphilum]|uniref:ion channel n=1 Tax=Lacimicrobium alkaliphilum TaxID=1526571 RepID=UPI000BFF0D03|nr:ion channel [Lacimicrobium alkaliphilum]